MYCFNLGPELAPDKLALENFTNRCLECTVLRRHFESVKTHNRSKLCLIDTRPSVKYAIERMC